MNAHKFTGSILDWPWYHIHLFFNVNTQRNFLGIGFSSPIDFIYQIFGNQIVLFNLFWFIFYETLVFQRFSNVIQVFLEMHIIDICCDFQLIFTAISEMPLQLHFWVLIVRNKFSHIVFSPDTSFLLIHVGVVGISYTFESLICYFVRISENKMFRGETNIRWIRAGTRIFRRFCFCKNICVKHNAKITTYMVFFGLRFSSHGLYLALTPTPAYILRKVQSLTYFSVTRIAYHEM